MRLRDTVGGSLSHERALSESQKNGMVLQGDG